MGDVEATIIQKTRHEGVGLDGGRYDLYEFSDGQFWRSASTG
jgi:hypothetical protein